MKKVLFFALAAACTLNVARADEFIDFGEDLGMWKGDFVTGDIDGDGKLDIIFSGEANGAERGAIMLGDDAGNFTPQTGERLIKLGLVGDIQLGDIDGDGDLDLIFAGWGAGSTADSKGIALNDGAGRFTMADREKYPLITSHTYKLDAGTATERDTVLNVNKFTSCGFADFNLDGLLDYYFFGNYTRLMRNKLDGEGNPVLDANNNPVKEEVPGTYRTNHVIYLQNANGTFTADNTFFGGTTEYYLNEPEVTIVDFDNDGTPDMWVNGGDELKNCNDRQENQRFSRLFKNDDGLAISEFNLTSGVSFEKSNGTSSWADVDGDGFLDMLHHGDGWLCSGENSDRMIRVYKNLNGGALQEKFAADVARNGYFGNGTTWVDWNGDGKLDFISGGWDEVPKKQATYMYLADNSADFTFTKATGTAFVGVSEQGFRIADLNNDRRPDLLECGFGDNSTINRRVTGWTKNTAAAPAAALEAPALKNVVIEGAGEEMMITFGWNVPASVQGKAGITWNFALKNKTTGKWLYNPMADLASGKRLVAGQPGNVYGNTSFILYALPVGEYEWTVQAIDGSYFGGAFAATQTFRVGTSGIHSINGYKPEVFVADNLLKVVGVQGAAQTLNVYGLSGALLNTASFTSNINIEMPQAGVYLVEVLNEDGASFRTKVIVK